MPEMNESNSSGQDHHSSHCAEHLRLYDPDRYLCAMFAPASARPPLLSLYAFNSELAMVRERVNEPSLGEMRFQWWRDQIESIYSQNRRPEGIAGFLDDFITAYAPERLHFDTLINSRSRDLSDELFPDTGDFIKYCVDTTAPLLHLSLLPLSASTSPHPIDDELIRHTAIAWAATGLIRAIPSHAAQGRCLMPLNLLERHGLTVETVGSKQARPSMKKVVRDIMNLADDHLKTARTHYVSTIDPTLFPAFLPLALAGFYLSGIRKSGFDPFHSRVSHPNNAARAMRLLYASWRKRF